MISYVILIFRQQKRHRWILYGVPEIPYAIPTHQKTRMNVPSGQTWSVFCMSVPIYRKNFSREYKQVSWLRFIINCAFPKYIAFSDILQLTRPHSDGIVPDLHRFPFESIAGTYICGKTNKLWNIRIHIVYPIDIPIISAASNHVYRFWHIWIFHFVMSLTIKEATPKASPLSVTYSAIYSGLFYWISRSAVTW